MNTVLFFGDSLTAGYGLSNPSSSSYPALIQQKATAQNLACQAINAGVSGDTSAGGLARIDYWLARPITAFVLELGINDIIRRIPPQTTYNNLQAILNKVKAKYPAAKLALMGMDIPAFIPLVPNSLRTEFKGIYSRLATANNIAFVPFFLEGVAGKANLNLPDGLHPSAEGYQIIAGNVWPVIKPLLTNPNHVTL